MKVVVIGCTHAGTSAVLNVVKQYPSAEVTVYEKNDNISFLSCGIALYVEGVVKDVKGLFYSSPEELAKLGVKTKMQHDVLNVNFDKKKLLVKDLKTGNEFEDTYDKLVITTGSWPICPPFEGINLENVVLCKNFSHAQSIIDKSPTVQDIVVVGAGYIGVELVEAFLVQGKKVTLIDIEDRVMAKYFDKEVTDKVEATLIEHGAKLALGEKVLKFQGNSKVSKVITDNGEYTSDFAVLCIGFRPNTELFSDKLDMLNNGAILVNEYMKTSETDVFAAGDCAALKYNPTNEQRYIPLATNAVRMGALVGLNIMENKVRAMGTQGTSGIKVFDELLGAVGLTETEAKKYCPNVKTVINTDNYRPEFMPSYIAVTLKLIYDGDKGTLLGAQLLSNGDYTQTINTLSICIQNKMTMAEIAFVDQFFQPNFNKPWNLINSTALMAL